MPRPTPIHGALLGAVVVSGCGETASMDSTALPVLLARHPEQVQEVVVPQDSRDGVEPPSEIPVRGPYRLRRTVDGVHELDAPLPVRPRALFYTRAPDDMKVLLEDDDLNYRAPLSAGRTLRTWSFEGETLTVRLGRKDPPAAGELVVRYARATSRERGLNRRWSTAKRDTDFVFRSLQDGDTVRTGLLLPAPAHASFTVGVPANGRLWADVGILRPETADLRPSDGATLTAWVHVDGQDTDAGEVTLSPGVFRPFEADLSRWAGKEVRLTLATEPGDTPTSDYVFVGEPTVGAPMADPPRVVLVFIDTLRRDHLGIYGWDRNTTPHIDGFSTSGTVFEDTHACAPWTLPSVRGLLVGGLPEDWGRHETLQARLGAAGFTTAGFVGNVYLSANFDMERGWSRYQVRNWPRGENQVNDALAWLDAHDDRPAAVMVHFMDTHLPYREPVLYRNLWAGLPPARLRGKSFQRADVMAAARGKDAENGRTYIRDRYDSSLRYVDDQVHRVLSRVQDSDIVAIFSDHGEEFWDHNGFEHGHTLFEELLRVPLVIRAPDLAPGRVSTPVSLVDLPATLLDLAGVDRTTTDWADHPSLVPLAKGDRATEAAFQARKLPIGRLLYGSELWGVIADQHKYFSTRGVESVYDLRKDPGEERNLSRAKSRIDLAPYRAEMAEAFGWPVRLAFRLDPSAGTMAGVVDAELSVPGGIDAAWVGTDPTLHSEATATVDANVARLHWSFALGGSREIFVAPTGGADTAAPDAVLTLLCDGDRKEFRVRENEDVPALDGQSHTILQARGCSHAVAVTYAVVPQPPANAAAVQGFDAEVAGALKALGYLDRDKEE